MLYDPQTGGCAQQVCWLPLDQITPRQSQPFDQEDAASMAQLCQSIRRDGLIRPITVQCMPDGRFMVVSGNRRLMACRMLGMTHMDAVVLPGVAMDESVAKTVESLLNHRMHYLDEAKTMAQLMQTGAMTREDLARQLGLTSATVREKLRLADLDEGLRILIMEEGLPERTAHALLRLPDHRARMAIALQAAREHLGARDVELLVSAAQSRLPVPPIPGGRTITLMRDHRLYLNAIRAIAAQMKEAGIAAQLSERTLPDAIEVTLRLPTRRRRSEQRPHQSREAASASGR